MLCRISSRPAPRWSARCPNNRFLAGDAPAYVDYVVFSVFQWARIGSPRDVLADAAKLDATRHWRAAWWRCMAGSAIVSPAIP